MKKLNGLVSRVLYQSENTVYNICKVSKIGAKNITRILEKIANLQFSRRISKSIFSVDYTCWRLKVSFHRSRGLHTVILSQYFPILRFLLSYHDEFIKIKCKNDQRNLLTFSWISTSGNKICFAKRLYRFRENYRKRKTETFLEKAMYPRALGTR